MWLIRLSGFCQNLAEKGDFYIHKAFIDQTSDG